MRRKALKWYEVIKEIYPLIFWRQCDICNMEFVREAGDRADRYKWTPERQVKIPYYICGICADTSQEASELLRKKINKRSLRRHLLKL